MNEEVNDNNKKKQIRLAIIGIVSLLILTLGATFAYFMISTNNSSSKSQINVEVGGTDTIALQKVTDNLHVNLSAADMAEANKNTGYYGDDEADYVKTLEEGMHNLGKLTAIGGDGKTRYMCTANAVITMEVAEESDMGKYFQAGDAYLYISAGSLNERIDLSELSSTVTRTIPFDIGITSEGERQLEGYVEIINRDANQTYLADKTLNIDVTFQDLDCKVGVSEVETYLRDKDTDNKLTQEYIYGLYRYQGNSKVNSVDYNVDSGIFVGATIDVTDTVNNNYICLGSECSTEDSKDLYRIIGVTEDGILKVIKNSMLNDSMVWWTDNETEIKWPDSLIYQELNNNYYNSLSPNLQNKILNYNWRYAMLDEEEIITEEEYSKIEEKENEWIAQYGDDMSSWPEEIKKSLIQLYESAYLSFYNTETEKSNNMAIGKIGLMNITDYINSYENNIKSCFYGMFSAELSGVMPNENDYYSFSWLHQNPLVTDAEVLISPAVYDNYIDSNIIPGHSYIWLYGYPSDWTNSTDYYFRPVFFLTSDIKLLSNGTIDSPFTIGI